MSYLTKYLETRKNSTNINRMHDSFEEFVASESRVNHDTKTSHAFLTGLFEGMLDDFVRKLPFDEDELLSIVESTNPKQEALNILKSKNGESDGCF